jgi:hypothetical protein
MYEERHKKKTKQAQMRAAVFTPERALQIIHRQGEQEVCGTHSVHVAQQS